MHVLTGEVEPLAPLLIPIGEIVIWFVALALCLLCVYLAKALFGTASSAVGWIPLFGKVVSRSLTSIEQKIVSFMSEAANAADAKMGAAFHQLARVVDWIGQEIARHANLLYVVSSILLGGQITAAVRAAIDALRHETTHAGAQASSALRKVVHAEAVIERGIGRDVLPALHELEREYEHVIGKVIPDIRAGELELERGAIRTWKWIRTHPSSLAATAFAGAVAWALARLGGGWIRCNNWRNIGRTVCNAPSHLIQDLLGLVADFFVLTNICTVIPWLEEAFSVVAAPLVSVLAKAGAGLCGPGSHAPAALDVPSLHLPASAGYTLHLP